VEYKNLTEKEKIPALGLGTWHMGGGLRPDYSDDNRYISAIQYAIKSGLTHIDTAEIYGGGHTEEIIGKAIADFDRKKLFITSKVSPLHLSYDNILRSCEKSRKRLRTSYLDMYLVHWPNPLASMKKTMAAFDRLVEERLVRFIGLSNFSPKAFAKVQKLTKNKLVTNQVHYNLVSRSPEKELLDYCQREKVILTAYGPLAEGNIANKNHPLLEKIAQKYGKTKVQVALRWLLDKPLVITIPKASSKEHIDELIGSLGWNLSEEDQKSLDSL